jgi:hypothetical protein
MHSHTTSVLNVSFECRALGKQVRADVPICGRSCLSQNNLLGLKGSSKVCRQQQVDWDLASSTLAHAGVLVPTQQQPDRRARSPRLAQAEGSGLQAMRCPRACACH